MGRPTELHLDDRRVGEERRDDTGSVAFAFKSKTVRLSTLIALLTAAGGLFYQQGRAEDPPPKPPAYNPAKDSEQDYRLNFLEKSVEGMGSDLKYLRSAEERRQGREEAGRRR